MEKERPDEMEVAKEEIKEGKKEKESQVKMEDNLIKEKINRYFEITNKAFEMARESPENMDVENARDIFLDMVQRYISDAKHFEKKGELLNALSALNYAHGWLDAGASVGIFDVKDSELFTVDED